MIQKIRFENSIIQNITFNHYYPCAACDYDKNDFSGNSIISV